jgi:hypothetical protein
MRQPCKKCERTLYAIWGEIGISHKCVISMKSIHRMNPTPDIASTLKRVGDNLTMHAQISTGFSLFPISAYEFIHTAANPNNFREANPCVT